MQVRRLCANHCQTIAIYIDAVLSDGLAVEVQMPPQMTNDFAIVSPFLLEKSLNVLSVFDMKYNLFNKILYFLRYAMF
jgi:hypothetical protein